MEIYRTNVLCQRWAATVELGSENFFFFSRKGFYKFRDKRKELWAIRKGISEALLAVLWMKDTTFHFFLKIPSYQTFAPNNPFFAKCRLFAQ